MIINIIFVALLACCAITGYFLWQLKSGKPGKYMKTNIERLAFAFIAMGRDTPTDRKEWIGQMNFVVGIVTFLLCLVAVYFGHIHLCIPLIGGFALNREFNAEFLQYTELELHVINAQRRRMNQDVIDGCRNLHLNDIFDNVHKL